MQVPEVQAWALVQELRSLHSVGGAAHLPARHLSLMVHELASRPTVLVQPVVRAQLVRRMTASRACRFEL